MSEAGIPKKIMCHYCRLVFSSKTKSEIDFFRVHHEFCRKKHEVLLEEDASIKIFKRKSDEQGDR